MGGGGRRGGGVGGVGGVGDFKISGGLEIFVKFNKWGCQNKRGRGGGNRNFKKSINIINE